MGPYAFRGEIPFAITLQLFSKSVKRKAKIVFGHTPEGEFYDLKTKSLQVINNAFRTVRHIEVLALPDRGAPPGSQHWVHMQDLIVDGVLNDETCDSIMDAIDDWVARENAKRLKAAGLE